MNEQDVVILDRIFGLLKPHIKSLDLSGFSGMKIVDDDANIQMSAGIAYCIITLIWLIGCERKENQCTLNEFQPASTSESNECDNTEEILNTETALYRFDSILNDSLHLIATTTQPHTFYARYDDAICAAKHIMETSTNEAHRHFAESTYNDLIQNKSDKVKAFVDRCAAKGFLYKNKDEIKAPEHNLPEEIVDYVNEVYSKLMLEDETPPANGIYIYCSVAFEDEGKTYYYRTEDETLKCGDEVIVPIGTGTKKVVGRIMRIEHCFSCNVPFPPNQTKKILGKCNY